MPIPSLAFLIDVDNTLLDNDRAKADQADHLRALLGAGPASRFWELYEQVRHEEDVVDYPLTLARFAEELAGHVSKEQLAALASFLLSFPFHEYLYPRALETLAVLGRLGTTAITSDGDASFQGLKIARSGVSAAVDGRVVLYLHKEQHLAEIQALFPAEHYVVIDDKARVLSAQKAQMGGMCTTLHVRQGKYAQAAPAPGELLPDLSVASIAEVQQLSAERLRAV
jgi:FMN phosphatase YigB (HAD superfamily)